MNKDFEAYPIRQIRMSDEVWEDFKDRKIKSAETWNNFIKQENQNANQQNKKD